MPKKRQQNTEDVQKAIYIYCEGEKTEPQYIQGYIDNLTSGNRKFVVKLTPTKKNTPRQLVDVAVAFKKSEKYTDGDVVWIVYDRESPAKYSDELHAQTFDKALKNGIDVAVSNVCFEFWLLLHLQDTAAPYNSYDELCKNSEFRKLFKTASGGEYAKAGTTVFATLSKSVELARKRAARLRAAAKKNTKPEKSKPFQLNPYTNVDELLDAIDTIAEDD